MSDKTDFKKLRIFIASPGDVKPERDRVHAVATELNRTVADQLGITLEVLDWRNVSPGMGRPEKIILDELPVEQWDIFVGVLWLRFGLPPGAKAPGTGEDFKSGTEEEFSLAYDSWKEKRRPRILFYRCTRSANLDQLDPDQYKRVKGFFENFDADKDHPGLYQNFQTTDDFADRVRQDLTKLLFKYSEEVLKKSPPPPSSVSSSPRESAEVLQRRYLEKLQNNCSLLPLAAVAKESDPHASLRLTLDKVYIGLNTTLTVDKKGKLVQPEKLAAREEREETRPLTAFEAATREAMLVILGDPGSGKSSFINYLLWQLAERQLRPASTELADWPHHDRFPVRILLRELLATLQQEKADGFLTKGLEERQRQLCSIVEKHLHKMLEKEGLGDFAPTLQGMISDGHCLIVFDGLDEAPPDQRALLRNAVECFSANHKNNRVLVTCRILSYEKETVLPSFANVTLSPFDDAQMKNFIVRWYEALHQLGKPEDWAKSKTDDLQQAVQRLPQSMVRNPLLLTTLATVHANNVELPRQRVKLYQQAAMRLLRRWQEAKADKISLFEEIGLTEETKMLHALWELGHFGQNAGRAEEAAADIPRKEALHILEKNFSGVRDPGIAANRFLDDVDQTAGLLNGRGGASERVYAFPHRTFQEYFAGCYLVKRKKSFTRELKKLLAEGDYWRLAAQLGVEELLFNDGNEGPALDAAYFLCSENLKPKNESDWRGVLWAGYFAHAIGLAAIEKDLEGGGPKFLKRLRGKLVSLLEKSALPARERAEAGFILGRLGDPRPGVGDFASEMWIDLDGGRFTMGDKDYGPPHEVELSPFKISKYPITNAQFEKFVTAKGYEKEKFWSQEGWNYCRKEKWEQPRYWENGDFNLSNQPVVGVSWFEAEAFCNWLTEQVASGQVASSKKMIVRLPTEAEWEFAARGKDGRKYPWGDAAPTVELANYSDSQIRQTTAVGSYSKGVTPEGILDLAGNVWEWCLDWYSEEYYKQSKKEGVKKNPQGPSEGKYRVLRGGSWISGDDNLRSALRNWDYPVYWLNIGGFRVVLLSES